MAFSRFWNWLRSSWHSTTMPVGIWVMPDGGGGLVDVLSAGAAGPVGICICSIVGVQLHTPPSSTSGSTATVAALVWMRPPDSVSGTRWTRWTPLSNFSRDAGSRPLDGEHGTPSRRPIPSH